MSDEQGEDADLAFLAVVRDGTDEGRRSLGEIAEQLGIDLDEVR